MNAQDLCEAPEVELRLPADPAFAYLLRSTSAAVAVRANFTVDDLEDLKISVTEAMTLLLSGAEAGHQITACFRLAPGQLSVTLARPAGVSGIVTEPSFVWQVLTALAPDATRTDRDGVHTVAFTARSSVETP